MPLSAVARELHSVPEGGNRKARPHCRGSRLAQETCRGRSRLCLPGQRRSAGRGRLRPNRRGLPESEACRPPARTPHFPPHNVSRGARQSLAPAVRPELSRPCRSPPFPTRQSPGLRPAVPLKRDYLLWLFAQRLSLRGGHLELPDSSAAVAAAAQTVEASGSGGRGSRGVAHVLTASGTVEL